MTTIVKSAGAAHFLSIVPQLLGFVPRNSLVLVPFHGARSLGGMRVDLPPETEDTGSIAATVIGMICRIPTADAVAAIVYTDEGFGAHGIPHSELFHGLVHRAEDCGLRVTDALCVAADGWSSYFDHDCPAGGYPLGDIPAGHVAELPPPDRDQRAGTDLPAADLAEKERVGRALRGLEEAVRLLCGTDAPASAAASVGDTASPGAARIDPRALVAVGLLDDLPQLFEDALEWDAAGLKPYETALLAWCLSRPALRDIALVQWCSDIDGGDEALEAQTRWEAGDEYPAHLAMQMWGEGQRPDPERLLLALELARRAAAAAPRQTRPGALATCAWISWALGRSTHAEHYATLACEIEPEHGLGEIVRSFVLAGHLPDWAFQRPEWQEEAIM